MDEKNLLICDKESRYANGLGENFMQRKELAFRVYVCTNLGSVLSFSKEKPIHILLMDEGFSKEEREQVDAQFRFVLTKEKRENCEDNEKQIKKYQSAEKILAEVLEAFLEKDNTTVLREVETLSQKVLAVYSPIHRIGKTMFAIGMGKEIAKTKKTLYINMEEYADVGGRFAMSDGRNLGDLLYFMRQEEGNLALRLSAMVMQMDQLDYLPPMLMSTDLREVTIEEWHQLLVSILKGTSYECIVLDLGENVQGLLEVMQLCDKVYMPVLEDGISRKKVERYEEEIKRLNKSAIQQKTCKFVAVTDMAALAKRMVKEENLDG